MDSMNKSPPRTRKAVRKVVQRNEMSSWLHRRGKSMPVEDLTEDQRNDIQECFDLFDADGSGSLDMDEVLEACNVLGLDISGGSGGGGGMIGRLMDEMEDEGIDELDYPRFESVVCKTLGDIALLHARQQSTKQESADEAETDVLAGTRDRAMVFKRKQLMGNLLRGGSDLSEMVRDQEELIQEITARFRRVIKMDGKRTSQEQVMELLNNLDPVASAVAPGLTKHFKHLQNMALAKMKAPTSTPAGDGGKESSHRKRDDVKEASAKAIGSSKYFVSDKRVIASEGGVLSFRCGGDVIVSTPRSTENLKPAAVEEVELPLPTTPIEARQALRKQRTERVNMKLKLSEGEQGQAEEGREVERSGHDRSGQARHLAHRGRASALGTNTRTARISTDIDDAGMLDFLEINTAKLSDGKLAGGARLRAVRISDFYETPREYPLEETGIQQRQQVPAMQVLEDSRQGGASDRRVDHGTALPEDRDNNLAGTETALSLPWLPSPATGGKTTPMSATSRTRIAKGLPTASYSIPVTTLLLSGPVMKHDDTPYPPKRATKSAPGVSVPRLPLNKISPKDSSVDHTNDPQNTSAVTVKEDGEEADPSITAAPRSSPRTASLWPTQLPPLLTPSELRAARRGQHPRRTRGSVTSRAAASSNSQSHMQGKTRGCHTDRDISAVDSHRLIEPVTTAPLPSPPKKSTITRRRPAKGQSNYSKGGVGHLKVTPRSRHIRPIPAADTERSPYKSAFNNPTLDSLFSQVFMPSSTLDDDDDDDGFETVNVVSTSTQPATHRLKSFPANPIR